MTHFIKLILAAMLLCVGLPAKASDTLDASWLRLIKADFEEPCAVERVKVGSVVTGNNGFRSEQWFIHTCLGSFEYRVVYYPPTAFPGRATPYEATRVLR
jgi:hypothetical protein